MLLHIRLTRDAINGDSRSRAKFFSYGIVSIVGLKGVHKIGKLGRVGELGAATKADGALAKIAETGSKSSLPYNVLKTDKWKEFINHKIETHYQIRKEQIHQLLGS
jgi:hypothetical protein